MSSSESPLSSEQQASLDQKKVDIQIQNEYYLREHPELRYLIKNFYVELLERKPKDITQFAVSYFTRPTTVLKSAVEKMQKEEVKAPSNT